MCSVVLVLLLGFKGLARADYQPASTTGFCDERVAHDYARPFEQMPAVREAPSSGHLPFAPRVVTFDTPTTEILVPGQTLNISYGLGVSTGGLLPRRLAWTINSRLIQVNARGGDLRVVEQNTLKVDTRSAKEVAELEFSFRVSARPLFYLVETQFLAPNGRRLGHYGEYFRVVRPTRSTTLVAYPPEIRAGEELTFRVENWGTQTVSFGESFGLEKEVDGAWFLVSLPPYNVHMRRLGLGAGEVGACQTLESPRELKSGRYRVGKDLFESPHHVEAEFVVVP